VELAISLPNSVSKHSKNLAETDGKLQRGLLFRRQISVWFTLQAANFSLV
jgi:hypothetical protein